MKRGNEVIVGLAAVGIAGYLLYKSDFLSKAGDGLGKSLGALGDVGRGIGDIGTGLGGGVYGIGAGFGNLETSLGAGSQQLLQGVGSAGINYGSDGSLRTGLNANNVNFSQPVAAFSGGSVTSSRSISSTITSGAQSTSSNSPNFQTVTGKSIYVAPPSSKSSSAVNMLKKSAPFIAPIPTAVYKGAKSILSRFTKK